MAKIERSLGHVTTISHPYDFDLTVLTGNREVSQSLVTRRPTSALAMRLLNTHSAPYSKYSRAPSPRGSRRIYVYPPARNELVARELVSAELLCPRLMPLLRGRCSDAALLGRRPTGGTAAKKMYAADLRPPLLHPPSCRLRMRVPACGSWHLHTMRSASPARALPPQLFHLADLSHR